MVVQRVPVKVVDVALVGWGSVAAYHPNHPGYAYAPPLSVPISKANKRVAVFWVVFFVVEAG